jgi:hypothetical protein
LRLFQLPRHRDYSKDEVHKEKGGHEEVKDDVGFESFNETVLGGKEKASDQGSTCQL